MCKKRAFTLVEFLTVLFIFSIILIGVSRVFSILNDSLTSKRTEVAMYNDIDTINTNLEYFKNIVCDITIISTENGKTETDTPGVHDELYVTDINNPENYCYIVFKDNIAYTIRGNNGKETTTKLTTLKNLSIKKVSKVLISENSTPKYVDIDKTDSLIEIVFNIDDEFSTRLVRNFKIK